MGGAGGGSAHHSKPLLKSAWSLRCSLLTDAVHRLVVYYGDSCTISHSTVSACEGTAMPPGSQHNMRGLPACGRRALPGRGLELVKRGKQR